MKKKVTISLIVVLAVIVLSLVVTMMRQHTLMSEIIDQMEFEKEELQEEYEDLSMQFDGYRSLDIRNDSLQDLLYKEQQRVQDLLEELRVTKVTNARRIAELKKELATVRTVMEGYVRQIDSLNQTNLKLMEENRVIKQHNEQIKAENTHLATVNTNLTETVSRASMLEIQDLELIMLNRNDRHTKVLSQVRKLQLDFVVGKNITCPTGMKTVYIRLLDPYGELMQRDTADVFPFENSEIGYSVMQEFEYEGNATPITVYWSLNGKPQQGIYNADFFIDGALIGSFPIKIEK